MAITGGIKFFDRSQCLAKDGSVANPESGEDSGPYALSMNKYVRWDSVGSDDGTPVGFQVLFPEPTTFSRLFVVGTNIKEFIIFYNNSDNFTNVISLNGPLVGGITEMDNTLDTLYYEFDEVTANSITLVMEATQIPDQDKYITLIAVTNEIGTLEGYPTTTPEIDANEKVARTQNGKFITQKGFEVFSGRLQLEYTSQNDINIFNSLYEGQEPFLIWLCGGKFGEENFSVEFKNWRLIDLFQVQTSGRIVTTFRSNVYTCSPLITVRFIEEV